MPDDIARDRAATGRRPARPASPRPRDPELGRLDAALAGDVDELLSGSVEDVSRVLDTVFEEPADPPEPVPGPTAAPEPTHLEPHAVDREAALEPVPTAADPAGSAPAHLDHPADAEHLDHRGEPDGWYDHTAEDETAAWDSPGPARSHPLAVVLGLANAPYRMLPTSGRRVVDLLAITLLLWVPVVWTIVLVLRR